MNEISVNKRAWLWLTIPVAVLQAIAAASGLFFKGLYSASPVFVMAQAAGQDLVTLAIALTVLIVSTILAARDSYCGRIIMLGVLVYVVHSYLVTSFTVSFNPLFLVYTALLGCSSYALIEGFSVADHAGIKAQFSEKTPVKTVSIFFMVMVTLFYIVWFMEIVPAHISGELPRMISWAETPTNAFYVLDIALLLPAFGLTSVWL